MTSLRVQKPDAKIFMRLVDLTQPLPPAQNGRPTTRAEEVPLVCDGRDYTGVVWHFHHDSMAGTYIDFPGHIRETDDGRGALDYPPGKLHRVRAAVLHLDRADESGAIEAGELSAACPDTAHCGALVINALGKTPFDAIAYRSVFLAKSAVRWIIGTGIHLLVSDVYESRTCSEGVFPRLFENGVITVCHPVHLDRLTSPYVTLTALPLCVPGAAQLPCRVLAEIS